MMAGQKFRKNSLTEDETHTMWLAEKSVLQSNLQHMNQLLSARRSRQLSTLQEASETTSQFEHVAYTHVDDLPFLPISTLGSGLISEVDCVVSEAGDDGIPTVELVRKIIHLRGSRRRQLLSVLHEEAAVMKSLVHQHIVQITGTYETLTKPRQFGILMFPVGDEDLSQFLDSVPERGFSKKDIQKLEKWLLCLAGALDYVHSQGIRHKDIKPQNIICKGNEVFLTDFGQAHKFLKTSSTTGGQVDRTNHIYSAPEVLSEGKRGRSADIFSLGCVYVEMATVITHRTLKDFHAHRTTPTPKSPNPKETANLFSTTQGQIKSWFENCSWPEIYELLKMMMGKERRPRAYEIVATFVAATTHPTCECVHGPILPPSYWDLAIEFELLPGLVEYPSPGGTFGLPMPKPSEILQTARDEIETEISNEAEIARRYLNSESQVQNQVLDAVVEEEGSQISRPDLSPDLLASFLALMEDPSNTDLQRRYSKAEANSLPILGESSSLPSSPDLNQPSIQPIQSCHPDGPKQADEPPQQNKNEPLQQNENKPIQQDQPNCRNDTKQNDTKQNEQPTQHVENKKIDNHPNHMNQKQPRNNKQRHVLFDIPPSSIPERPRRNFSLAQPLMVESSRDDEFPEFI